MNKKLIALIIGFIAQANLIIAQDVVYSSDTSSHSSCAPQYTTECYPQQKCGGRRWTGSQRWRNCCTPRVRKCRPKRTCCPRLRCCRPRPACCPPIAPVCDAAPCLKGDGYEVRSELGSFVEETGVTPAAAPVVLQNGIQNVSEEGDIL